MRCSRAQAGLRFVLRRRQRHGRRCDDALRLDSCMEGRGSSRDRAASVGKSATAMVGQTVAELNSIRLTISTESG